MHSVNCYFSVAVKPVLGYYDSFIKKASILMYHYVEGVLAACPCLRAKEKTILPTTSELGS